MSNFDTLKRLVPVPVKQAIKNLLAPSPAAPVTEQAVPVAPEILESAPAPAPAPTPMPAPIPPPAAPVALPMSFATLREMLASYAQQPPDIQQNMSADAFLRISIYPQVAHFLGTDFCLRRFGHTVLVRQLIAAYHLGMGRPDEAHALLAAIDAEMPSAFNALMAARCYMRPPGREADAVAYLASRAQDFPDDATLIGNLAAGYFVLGETDRANDTLARILPELRHRLTDLDQEHAKLQSELDAAMTSKTINRVTPYDDTAYAEAAIWQHWEPYFDEMVQQAPHLYFGWYRSFYRDALKQLGEGVSEVVNFGVMCAQPDFEAAQAMPNVAFYGVDRQKSTSEHNALAFQAPNLHFVASEIEDFLGALPDGPTRSLLHGRTATLCYPEKIKNLYRLCAAKGIRKIAVFENVALSHGAYRFMDFDDFEQDALIFKSHQFIHNYPKFLRDAGYRITGEQRLFSPSITPFPDIEIGSVHIFLTAEMA